MSQSVHHLNFTPGKNEVTILLAKNTYHTKDICNKLINNIIKKRKIGQSQCFGNFIIPDSCYDTNVFHYTFFTEDSVSDIIDTTEEHKQHESIVVVYYQFDSKMFNNETILELFIKRVEYNLTIIIFIDETSMSDMPKFKQYFDNVFFMPDTYYNRKEFYINFIEESKSIDHIDSFNSTIDIMKKSQAFGIMKNKTCIILDVTSDKFFSNNTVNKEFDLKKEIKEILSMKSAIELLIEL